RLPFRARDHRALELLRDRADDTLGDPILQLEYVVERALITIGPKMPARIGVDQLAGNADAAGRFAHAAFEQIAYAELAAYLLHVARPSPIDEARIACDHEQPAYVGQGRDDVLHHAVGEIILCRVAAHVHERQHGDRGLVRQRGRRDLVRFGADHIDSSNETKALSSQRSDESLLVTAVADRGPGGVDMARERGFRDDAPVPNRLEQVVLADDAFSVRHEVEQNIEHLRSDGYRGGRPRELAPIGVEHAIPELELHRRRSFAFAGGAGARTLSSVPL